MKPLKIKVTRLLIVFSQVADAFTCSGKVFCPVTKNGEDARSHFWLTLVVATVQWEITGAFSCRIVPDP